MSNTITAYFKGRVGVAEAVYQNDYGIVMAFDSIELPAHFDCYFSRLNQEEALPGVGADSRVAIPNSILADPGNVTVHIPLHAGENDSEVEYVVYFKVIGRARPINDGTPTQMTAIEQALALLQNPITNIEQIVNEALAFTGETFEEMQEDLDEWKTDTEEGLETWKGGVESDFNTLQAQFDTAVAAVTTDTEVTDIRVGDDEVTYTTAGVAVRTQFANVKSAINLLPDVSTFGWELGSLSPGSGTELTSDTRIRSDFIPVSVGTTLILSGNSDCLIVYLYSQTKGYISDSAWTDGNTFVVNNPDAYYARVLIRKSSSNNTLYEADIPTQIARLKFYYQLVDAYSIRRDIGILDAKSASMSGDLSLIAQSNVVYELDSYEVKGTASWNSKTINLNLDPSTGETFFLHINSVENCM